ncbi:MAG: polysaccharide biosynthesis tyrosine autokinase, partial [Planctomycetia bacterium]
MSAPNLSHNDGLSGLATKDGRRSTPRPAFTTLPTLYTGEADAAAGWTNRPNSAAAAAAGVPHPVALLQALGRRWPSAFALATVLGAAAAAVSWVVVPPTYETSTLLRIATNEPRLVFAANEGGHRFENYKKTQLELLKSRKVLNVALKDPEVKDLAAVKSQADAAGWLSKMLDVTSPGANEVVRLTLRGSDREALAPLANAVGRAYFQVVVDAEVASRKQTIVEIESAYQKKEAEVRDKREQLKKIAGTLGTTDTQALTLKQQITIENFGDLQKEHTRLQSSKRKAQVELEAMRIQSKNTTNLPISSEQVAVEMNMDHIVRARLYRIAQLKDLIDRYEREAKDPSGTAPYVEELARVRSELDLRKEKLKPAIEKVLRADALKKAEETLMASQRQFDLLAEQEKILTGDMTTMAGSAEKIGMRSYEMEELRGELDTMDKTKQKMYVELEAKRVESESKPRVTLVQEASIPADGVDVRKSRITAMAGMGLFGLALFAVGLMEYRKRRVDTTSELSEVLGLRRITTLPIMGRPSRNKRVAAAAEEALRDATDQIRAILLRDTLGDGPRIIQITSAVPGEGKTTLACQLAITLGMAGRKTVVVDADLRSPDVHHAFKVRPAPGVAEFLTGKLEAAEVVVPTEYDNVSVVAAGKYTRPAVQALGSTAMQNLIEQLRGDFDYVLIDSAPVLVVADALHVSSHVESVLLSTTLHVTTL